MTKDLIKAEKKKENARNWHRANRDLSRQRAIERYRRDPEESKRKHKEYLKTRPKAYSAWILIKSRAKKLNLPFDLELSDLPDESICPVFGTKISFGGTIPLDPMTTSSVDRLIPEKGYTKENIRVISFRANAIKNDASIEDLKKVLAYLEDALSNT